MKTKKQFLLLPLLFILMGIGCKKEGLSVEQNISGSWRVSKQIFSGELKGIVAPPENAFYTDILIVIPDTIKGDISGNTFRNSIWVQFEIENEEQIHLKNYGGTRIVEDNWGTSFRENLLNTVKFSISNNELIFIDSQNQIVIVFIKN